MTGTAPAAARGQGMVASSQVLASEIGARVLREGGNAADACVAMDAALHVTEPTSTGLGGDLFALHYEASSGRITSLNGSGRAPAALTLDRARAAAEAPDAAGMWVTVPGCCAGWCDLAVRHGSRPLSELLAPAVELAEQGFRVGAVTAAVWSRGLSQLRSAELTVGGRAPAAGEVFRNPGLAETLGRIASDGAEAFYRGPVARDLVEAVHDAGGVLTQGDLAAHTSTWEAPITARYRDVDVWQCPPNGQGLAALLALRVLDGFELGEPDDPRRWHLLVEAMRLGFADARWWVSDPAHVDIPLAALLSNAYADRRRTLVDPERATLDQQHGAPDLNGGTVYHCAVDGRGNACSMVSSHFIGFGSGVVPKGRGFVLHNRARGFSLDAGHPNAVAPGKRPYHTISPALVTRPDGTFWGTLGVMGGFMQPQGHVQVLTAMIDDEATPQEALDRFRFCIDSGEAGGVVQLESGVTPRVVDGLRSRGHPIVADVPSHGRALFGRGQIIRRAADGSLEAGSDRRADGAAALAESRATLH